MLHKIKFNNDDIFEFIPCSLINIDTSEVYINESAEKNLMNLSYLKSNDIFNKLLTIFSFIKYKI